MKLHFLGVALLAGGLLGSTASAALVNYSQNFEGMIPAENVIPNTLSADGWLVGANVFGPTGSPFIYNYFAFPAPNGGSAFSGVVTGEGGVPQGTNQLSVYNDYNNGDHGNGTNRRIEANVFRDIGIITAADVGKTFTFSFDVKQGNIGGSTTANAFLKVLDQPSFGLVQIASMDTTAVGTNWTSGSLSLTVQPGWVGDLMQIGFTNTANNFGPSGVFYDNLSFVPEPASLAFLIFGVIGCVAHRRRR